METKDANQLLFKAAENGDLIEVKRLIEVEGADPNAAQDGGWTPLMSAAGLGSDLEVVTFLVKSGAEISRNSNFQDCAVLQAAYRGNNPILRYLASCGADLHVVDEAGNGPLHMAAAHGPDVDTIETKENGPYIEVIGWLLDQGFDINSRGFRGETPLMAAAKDRHVDIVDFLVERGADTENTDDEGNTALLSAVRFAIMMYVNSPRQSSYEYEFDDICSVIRRLHGHGANMDAYDSEGFTALTLTVYDDAFIEMTRTLLECGADPDVPNKDKNGSSPLSMSAERGQIESIRLLIEFGATVNLQDNHGQTALMLAALGGSTEAIMFLVEAGADIALRHETGATAARFSVMSGSTSLTKYFIDLGADVEERDDYGNTLLCDAALHNHSSVVDVLLENGACINAIGSGGMSPLMWASKKGNINVVQMLARRSADLSLLDDDGKDAITLAKENSHVEVATWLEAYVAGEDFDTYSEGDDDGEEYSSANDDRDCEATYSNVGSDDSETLSDYMRAIGTRLSQNMEEFVALAADSESEASSTAELEDALGQGDFGLAVRIADQQLQDDPASQSALMSRALAHSNLGNNEEALRDVQECLEMADGSDVMMMLSCGGLLGKLGQFDEALRILSSCVAGNPEEPNAWANLSSIRARAGDISGAIEARRNHQRLAPDDPDAHYFLACYLAACGEGDEAVESLEQAIALDESCREDARDEDWFESIWANERFQNLLKQ